jgi:hypothetical protein
MSGSFCKPEVPPYRLWMADPQPRYIYNGRALAEWVHYDFLYQAFHNAALILLNESPETVLNVNPQKQNSFFGRQKPQQHWSL